LDIDAPDEPERMKWRGWNPAGFVCFREPPNSLGANRGVAIIVEFLINASDSIGDVANSWESGVPKTRSKQTNTAR